MSSVASASSVAPLAGPTGDDLRRAGADQRRVSKAALDFEGLLLASWMEAAEQANRDLSGDQASAGSETMGALGVQALASGIAARGGIGLAKLLLTHLPTAPAPSGESELRRVESERVRGEGGVADVSKDRAAPGS